MIVNKKKSGIMAVRTSKKTKDLKEKTIRGFPVVEDYKYLGVQISDALNIDLGVS